MRTLLSLLLCIFAGTAAAETVTIEASQDNTLYESTQGALSNGAGTRLFTGLTSSNGVRRAVFAFKDLSAIPAGSTIKSVKLHMYVSRQNSDPTMTNLLRLESDWGEGTSDASGPEGGGAPATTGDATWNHTFFDNMLWSTPGGDFNQASRAQLELGDVGPYTWDSTATMVADVQDWLDNPQNNFGWILLADETVGSARRIISREGSDSSQRPRIEVEYDSGSTGPAPGPAPGSDFSGPWFDPDSDGEGFLVFNTPAGWLIYYFGYSADGERLWLVSNLLVIENLAWEQEYTFNMLVGEPGTFDMPTPSDELEEWGTLNVSLDNCVSGIFVLDGEDGLKIYDAEKIVGIETTSCSDQ